MSKKHDLRGRIFGMWEVLCEDALRAGKKWLVCRYGCDSKTIKSVYTCNLITAKIGNNQALKRIV